MAKNKQPDRKKKDKKPAGKQAPAAKPTPKPKPQADPEPEDDEDEGDGYSSAYDEGDEDEDEDEDEDAPIDDEDEELAAKAVSQDRDRFYAQVMADPRKASYRDLPSEKRAELTAKRLSMVEAPKFQVGNRVKLDGKTSHTVTMTVGRNACLLIPKASKFYRKGDTVFVDHAHPFFNPEPFCYLDGWLGVEASRLTLIAKGSTADGISAANAVPALRSNGIQLPPQPATPQPQPTA